MGFVSNLFNGQVLAVDDECEQCECLAQGKSGVEQFISLILVGTRDARSRSRIDIVPLPRTTSPLLLILFFFNVAGETVASSRSASLSLSSPSSASSGATRFFRAYCGCEFESRAGMAQHRRNSSLVGTPCADPRNSKSMSFTARGDHSAGILRQHDTLGVLPIPSYFCSENA